MTGAETELHWALTPNLSVQAAATFNDGALGQDFNSAVDPSVVLAEEGRELPYLPRWKYAVNGRYEWEQGGSVAGYAQLTYSFTESWNLLITEPFQAEANGEDLPAWPPWRAGGEALILDRTVRAEPLDPSLCTWL